jgi:hypothetical protein
MKKFLAFRLGMAVLFAVSLPLSAFAQADDDQITDASTLASAHAHTKHVGPRGHLNGQGHARFGTFDVDSIGTFNGHYFTPGIDANGNVNNHWYFNTVGNPPQQGRTTTFNAPVVPVSLDLRNFDGSPRFVGGHPLISDVTPFITPALNSPVFSNATWDTSDTPTQITDAVQRAEYWESAKSSWHTMLSPSVKTARKMILIRGTYAFALNHDGTCCAFVLVDFNAFVNALFPSGVPDNTTVIGAAEVAGDITTRDISSFLFPNTFLFEGNTSNCCILGFHSYDVEPGDASNGNLERRFVMNYSSWISPNIFGPTFTDVTALSHEIAETFNDPFVASDGIHNVTPWWLSPNGNCQNDLEDGDVIEGLPNATFPITMNGFTYHPQNEALLQWFQFQSPSDAFMGAYSYPNRNVLTSPSAPQAFNCGH